MKLKWNAEKKFLIVTETDLIYFISFFSYIFSLLHSLYEIGEKKAENLREYEIVFRFVRCNFAILRKAITFSGENRYLIGVVALEVLEKYWNNNYYTFKIWSLSRSGKYILTESRVSTLVRRILQVICYNMLLLLFFV